MSHDPPQFSRQILVIHGTYRYVHPEWRTVLDKTELRDQSAWHRITAPDVIGEPDTTQVFRIPSAKGQLIFKRYLLGRSWRYFLRPGRAACEWAGLHAFARGGLPVPELVAVGEDRVGGRLTAGYIVTREVEHTRNLEDFARHVWRQMPDSQRKTAFCQIRERLFSIIHQAHGLGIFHQDLHWRNILVRPDEDDYRLWLIDCPRYTTTVLNRNHAIMVDLSCLARLALEMLSAAERFRSLLIFFHGNREKTRDMFRLIATHHRRSKHPPVVPVATGNR